MMDEQQSFKLFFEKIKIINYKYEKLNEARHTEFNIFSILRKPSDEVNLHSAFIAELLNPNGCHKLGNKFLELFIRHVLMPDLVRAGSLLNETFTVGAEVDAGCGLGRIDIVAKGKQQIIIIENKIYAPDRKKQLERYWQAAKNMGFCTKESKYIVYLTRYGDEPSVYTAGKIKEEVLRRSYKTDIKKWIDACIKEVAQIPTIRETLVQYADLIDNLTGKSISEGELMEITELLMTGNNLKMAQKIRECLEPAQLEIQKLFWNELLLSLNCIDQNKKWFFVDKEGNQADINSTVDKYYCSKSNYCWYSLDCLVMSIPETNYQLTYRIELEGNIYIGFGLNQDGKKIKLPKSLFVEDLHKVISALCSWNMSESWFGWKYPDGYEEANRLDFRNFNTEAVYSLSDSTQRKAVCEDIANEVKKHLQDFMAAYEKLNREQRQGVTLWNG